MTYLLVIWEAPMNTELSSHQLVQKLEQSSADLEFASSGKRSAIEREVLHLLNDICDELLQAGPESRADLHIAFQFEEGLIEILGKYVTAITQQASRAAASRPGQRHTYELVQRAAAAHSLAQYRLAEEMMVREGLALKTAARAARVDLNALFTNLNVPAKSYVQRAIQYYRGKQPIKALKGLNLALRIAPQLEKNERVIALATTLTAETPISAMITISDGYVLRKHIEELKRQRRAQSAEITKRSTLEILRSWLS